MKDVIITKVAGNDDANALYSLYIDRDRILDAATMEEIMKFLILMIWPKNMIMKLIYFHNF